MPAELKEKPRALRTTTTTEVETDTGSDGDDGSGEPTVDDQADPDGTSTTLPADEDPAFIQAAEEDGAPPGIVPTDPEKAAACR